MTKFDPAALEWREPWEPVSPEGGPGLTAELEREVGAGHRLFHRRVQAVGRRQDCDDVR